MFRFSVGAGNNPGLIRQALLERGCWAEEEDCSDPLVLDLIWKPTNLPLRCYCVAEESLRKRPRPLLLNHFENNRVITTKTGLLRQLRAYYRLHPEASKLNYNVFDSTPTSFILTAGLEDRQRLEFVRRFNELQRGQFGRDRVPGKHLEQNLWLLKPANLNQGRGIEVVRSLREVETKLGQKQADSLWVVQKYIERPLLYQGRKFDIRIWVLVTPRREVYFYRKGYIRTSSDPYATDVLSSQVHLTNNCLQKHCQGYSRHEPGNTLPLQILEPYLRGQEKYRQFSGEMLQTRMQDLVIDCIQAAKPLGACSGRVQFQLFGFDFLIDQDLRTWLIQVNVNPYLGVPNDYIAKLLPKMADDMFKLVADPVFPPRLPRDPSNDFKLIFSEAVNLRSSFSKSFYPIPSLAPPPNRKTHQDGHKLAREPSLEQSISQLLETAVLLDLSLFQRPVGRLVSKLCCWELISQKQLHSLCRVLTALGKSKVGGLLLEEQHQGRLVGLLQKRDTPPGLQQAVLKALGGAHRDVASRRKLDSTRLIRSVLQLIALILEGPADQTLLEEAVRLLAAVTGDFNRQFYIPGETREAESARSTFLEEWGAGLLLVLEKANPSEGLRRQATSLLQRLEIADWELHKRSSPLPELKALEQRFGLCACQYADFRIESLRRLQTRLREEQQRKLQERRIEERKASEAKQRKAQEKKGLLIEYMRRKRIEGRPSERKEGDRVRNKSTEIRMKRQRVQSMQKRGQPSRSTSSYKVERQEVKPDKAQLEQWIQQRRQLEQERRRAEREQSLRKAEQEARRKEELARGVELGGRRRRRKGMQIVAVRLMRGQKEGESRRIARLMTDSPYAAE